ncbi:MAG TPA: hypothetical protein ENH94_03430 [Phycisphaerales bacterium]|nr:hypothetical protein [Phycisphaerales bacterium]
MPKTSKPKIPAIEKQETVLPPTASGPEVVKAREDVKARARKSKGRRASRVTTPGTLAISDVNIIRPELKDKLGG